MSYSYVNQEYPETKSHSDYCDQFDKWEQNQTQATRRNSLPTQLEDGEKNLKERYILSRINELGLDQNKALYILENMAEECIKQHDENVVLHRVIQTILLMESFPKATSKQQQGHYFDQIKQLIGKASPNLFSYLNDQNYKEQKENLLGLTCNICLNELKKQNIKLECYHSFCVDCLQNYIIEKINIGQVEEINCPQIDCEFKFNNDILESLLDQENFKKLKRFRNMRKIQLDQNFIWCPRPGCEEIVRKSKMGTLKCSCGQYICHHCNRKSHVTLSCKDQLDEDIIKYAKKLKVQRCDNCRSLIQKREECNHMVCQQCKYQFCWLCKQKFTDKHYKYYNIFGCPGMRFSQRDPFKYPNICRFFRFLFVLIFGVPIFLIGFIIGYIVLSFALPAIIYMNSVHFEQFQKYHCCKKTAYVSLLSIACILLSPFSFVVVTIFFILLIIFWICYGIQILYDWLKKK
ncbi:unnamed protein product [Paramecium octaurelia]|uniref:RBR-type E3 ubiquitin transferase n=1 Tax=Paramecium octaurelia TaxID=43137 RepID=A0A8S1TIX3_PAROT|nr:unnamed protein product [Paramecium octaurelia]